MKLIGKHIIYQFVLATVFSFVVTACTEDIVEGGTMVGDTVTLTLAVAGDDGDSAEEDISGVVGTKTVLVNDQKVQWSDGDVVYVNGVKYDLKLDSSNPSVAVVENVAAAEEYFAFYGSRMSPVRDDSGSWSVYFPYFAVVTPGTFASGANPMAAYSTDENLVFRHLGGTVKIGLTGNGETISKIALKPNSSTNLVGGYFKIPEDGMRNGDWTLAPDSGNKQSLVSTLFADPDNALTLSSEPVWLYITTLPFEDSNGITIEVMTTDGEYGYKGKAPVRVKRATVLELPVFKFEKMTELAVSEEVNAGPLSFSCSLTGSPEYKFRYLALNASLWQMYKSTFIDNAETPCTEAELMERVLGFYSSNTTEIGADGTVKLSIESAINSSAYEAGLNAYTEYILLAQYVTGTAPLGSPVSRQIRTAPPSGNPPQLNLVPTVTYNTIKVNVKTSGAAAILDYRFDKSRYDSYISAGKTDAEIIKEYGEPFSDEVVAAAEGANGFDLQWRFLTPHTEHVIIVMATTATGMWTYTKLELTTDYYIFDPSTELETVSTSATVTTDMFNLFFGIPEWKRSNVTLKKVPSMDVFVVDDLFVSDAALAGAGCTFGSGSFRTIIDARVNAAPVIEYLLNDTGIRHGSLSSNGAVLFNEVLCFGSYCSINSSSDVEQFPKGSYSGNSVTVTSLVAGNSYKLFAPAGNSNLGTLTINW